MLVLVVAVHVTLFWRSAPSLMPVMDDWNMIKNVQYFPLKFDMNTVFGRFTSGWSFWAMIKLLGVNYTAISMSNLLMYVATI